MLPCYMLLIKFLQASGPEQQLPQTPLAVLWVPLALSWRSVVGT